MGFKVGNRVKVAFVGHGVVTFIYEGCPYLIEVLADGMTKSSCYKESDVKLLATASPSGLNINGIPLNSSETDSFGGRGHSVFGPYPVMDESATFVQDKLHILGCDCGGKKTYGVISKETCAHWCQTQSLGGSSGGCL